LTGFSHNKLQLFLKGGIVTGYDFAGIMAASSPARKLFETSESEVIEAVKQGLEE